MANDDRAARVPENWLGRIRNFVPEVLSGGIGLLWILAHGGRQIIDPRDTRWLMCGDWAWHHLGWLFYQRDAWRFPLGAIRNYPDPWGTTTVYTDSVPGLALLLKLLPLPDGFQYLGLWIVANFVLSGFWGARLVRLFTSDPLATVLGAIPFVVTPILLFRTGHAALSAHWLLLWALHIYLRPARLDGQLRGVLRSAFVFGPVAAAVHTYLLAMGTAILLALWWRIWKVERRWTSRSAWLHLVVWLGATALTMALLGHFNGTGPTGGGYGTFVADLLTFVDSRGWSRILPPLPTKPGEIEGFAYLGLGVLGLLAFVAVNAIRTRSGLPWRPLLKPLVVTALFLFVYALSVRVTVAGHTLVETDFTFFTLAKIFQSSGRFAWPLYYLLILLAVAGTLHFTRARPWLGPGLLALAAALQVLEQGPKSTRFGNDGIPVAMPSAALWKEAPKAYRTIKVFPPERSPRYDFEAPQHGTIPLGYVAYQQNLTVDAAILARAGSRLRKEYVKAITSAVQRGALALDAIYVVWDQALPEVRDIARCGRLDGYNVCVSRENRDAFARGLSGSGGD